MSLSIFDDDDLVESLGYSREYDVSQRFAFSVHRERSAEADRENFARWYAATRGNPERWAAYLAHHREAKRAAYARKRVESGAVYIPLAVRSERRRTATVKRGRPWCLTDAQIAEIVSSSERGVVLAERFGVTDKAISYHRTRHRRTQERSGARRPLMREAA